MRLSVYYGLRSVGLDRRGDGPTTFTTSQLLLHMTTLAHYLLRRWNFSNSQRVLLNMVRMQVHITEAHTH